jgi:hypothetical protein
VREEDFEQRPVRTSIKALSMGWVVTLFAIGLVLVTSTLLWVFSVSTSDIKGQGDAQRIKNSAPSRIKAQELFETRYQDILAADRTIDVTSAALVSTPGDTKLQTELIGQKQYCITLVGKYNADSRKFTMEDFRGTDLPYQINNNDPDTNCKESR